jgi:D-alanyl-D-alanine carboxypeptidase/D-alanyl-D-alanine-endopeptidase (penicillin-binding protein 4)
MRSRAFTSAWTAVAAVAALTMSAAAQRASRQPRDAKTLDARIDAILARPEFKHTVFGIEFYSLDTSTPIYTLNADKLFVPGSTTKLVTMGSALQVLGADYRFRTRVYRTGQLDARGTLDGDLVLVASGDPNLSGRIRDGETLALENIDHSYGGADSHGLDGDPLAVIRKLAAEVSAHGVKRVSGRVIVDASLFPEGERDGGTGFVISPVIVNDNAIDILLTPTKDGERAVFRIAPHTAYATFINQTTTGKPGSAPSIHVEDDVSHGDGTHTVTISGSIPADTQSFMYAYRVPQPSRFAEILLAEALHERGIVAAPREASSSVAAAPLSRSYTTERVVAEHVSPPFAEEVKITLKLSQNLHASATPLLLGALGAPTSGDVQAVAGRGFARMRQFLETTGADVSGASQSDGAGADAHFTPDFMVHYLAFMAKQPSAKVFHEALPILGRDGTLWNVQAKSPAAGHVYAKTGTYSVEDLLHDGIMVNGKGLAGYLTTVDGRHLAFAIYANNIPLKDAAAVTPVAGEALGEIAAAAYDARPPRS